MNAKKSQKSNLENKRFLFFEIGVILALALTLYFLRWETSSKTEITEGVNLTSYIDEEIIPITREPLKKPPLPPQVTTIIVIEDNSSSILEGDFDFTIDIDPTEGFGNFEAFPVDEEIPEETPFIIVKDMPKFLGGDVMNFKKYIQGKVKYPQLAQEMNIQGTVYVYFVVNSKGKLTDIKISRGVDPLLDNEVLGALQDVPTWEPGKQHGNPVSVMFTMPVSFKLN